VRISGHAPDVGAPDPERRNSPILDDAADAETLTYDPEAGGAVCYFNDRAYAPGEYVCSGNELLRCEPGGVWVRRGPCVPT
jgi:hypothetical protein